MEIESIQKYIKNKNVKVKIAILGSPGSGKSTLSSGLLYFSKLFQFKCEAVPEIAKWDFFKQVDMSNDSYEEKKYKKQLQMERIFPNDLDVLICEAPLIMSYIFSYLYKGKDHPVTLLMRKKAENHKKEYTHFFITRKLHNGYETFGRNESESESEELHKITLQVLEELGVNFTLINKYDEHVPLKVLEMIGAISCKD